MIGIESIGTTCRFESLALGCVGCSMPVPRLTSTPRSTPVPWASAGERAWSETLSTRVGIGATGSGLEMVISTQPETSKNRKLTCPHAMPCTYRPRSPPLCSATITVSWASAPIEMIQSRSSPATQIVPARVNGLKPMTASIPPPIRR